MSEDTNTKSAEGVPGGASGAPTMLMMGPEKEKSRTVFFVGDVTEELCKSTIEKLIELAEDDATAPIYLVINTYGGEVYDTFAVYDVMKLIAAPVYTIGLGKIMSAGCLLLAAGAKGHRRMGKNACFMYHAGWGVVHGTVWAAEATLAEFKRQEAQYDKRFSEETGMSVAQVEQLYDKAGPTRDSYILPERCLELGIVDTLV